MEHGDPPGSDRGGADRASPAAGGRDLDATMPLEGSGATVHGARVVVMTPSIRDVELRAGDRIGRFVLLEQLGAGGMGVVFAARDTDLERNVAIKVLQRHRTNVPEAALRARLLREAQAIARLSHRNVVTVHEVGTIDQGAAAGQVFLAMELIEGETLAAWQRGGRGWREIVEVYLQAARGLAAAHAAGLVHRDFKPDNALLGRDGEVRVTDFGLAFVGATAPPAGPSPSSPAVAHAVSPSLEDSRLTTTGDVMGTPLYMAPEQRAGRTLDGRADQYAFCVALYRALHGVFPFGADSEDALARRAEKLELTPPRNRAVPRDVQRVLVRGLSPDPDARWPDMTALAAALSTALVARRRRALAGGAAVLAGGAVAAVLIARADTGGAAACAGGAAELATVWNAEARRLGHAGFAASGLPGGGDAWRRVETTVDGWGAEWSAAYDGACRARVEGRTPAAAQARHQACLAGQRDVLAGLVQAWARADRELAARGAEVALRLPRVADCAAPQPLVGGEAVAGAAALRATLTELQVASISGRFAPAVPIGREALARARTLGDRTLEAVVGIWLGRLERQAADEAARTTFFDAAAAAEAAGRDDLAVEAWAEWIYVAASVGVPPAEIEAASRRADAALQRAGNDRRLRGLLRNNQGVAAYEALRDRDAIALYEESIAVRVELFGAEDPRVAEVMDNLASAWRGVADATTNDEATRKEAHGRAMDLAQRALAIRLATFGESSAATARSLNNVALGYAAFDQLDEAEGYLRRALAAKEATLGPDHPGVGSTLVNLGNNQEIRGRYEEALALYRRAVAAWDRPAVAGVGPPCVPLENVHDMLRALGRPAEAIAPIERCAELRKDDRQKRRLPRRLAAEARLEAGQVDAALAVLRELVADEADAYAADDPRRAPALIVLARAERAAGRAAQAAATIERARRLVAADPASPPALFADVELTIAEIDAARGRTAAARAAAAAALARCAPAGECGWIAATFRRRAAAFQ